MKVTVPTRQKQPSAPKLIETLLNIITSSSEFHLASHYGFEPAAESLKGWLDKLRPENQSLVVAIVGEFNAGKSTLVNALLNREVALADHFQATMTLAFYYPDANENVRILYQNSNEQQMSIDEFLDLCKHPEDIKQAQRVDVHIPSSPDFVLIDTPGMGSLDEELQDRAEEAVKEADAIVWVIDPNDLLGAQEGAFLRRAKDIGLPILVVISKADDFPDKDIEESIEWLSGNLGYQKEQLIAVSAQNHLERGNDPGVVRLMQELIQMSATPQSIRALAQAAKEREMVDEAVRLVDLLQKKLDEDLRWIGRERELIRSQAATVESHLQDFSRLVFTEHLRSHLTDRVPKSLQPGQVKAVLEESLADFNGRVPNLCEHIMKEVREETESVWKQQFAARNNDLQRKIEDLMSRPLEQRDQMDYLEKQLAEIAFREEVVMQTITAEGDTSSPVGLTLIDLGNTLADVWSNWFGRLLGSLLGFIGELVGDVSPVREVPIVRFRRDRFIRKLCREFGDSIHEDLKSPIHEYVQIIADEALQSMCRQKWKGLTVQRIEGAKREVDQLQGELTALSRLGMSE